MSALIEVEHLSRYFGKICAVNDISFKLSKGEVLGFLGVNGAGKTTTMQMLSGCLAPSQGIIKINDYNILKDPLLAKQSLGYLPDTPPLYKDLTVKEYLHYCAQIHAIPKQRINAALDTVFSRCGLTSVTNRLISHLSKGFQQRIGIAQAIVHNPDLIILDEPTIGLDPIQIIEIRALIKKLGKNHGVILSTHILNEVQETCTHVQIIHQGKLIVKESIDTINKSINESSVIFKTTRPIDKQILLTIPGVQNLEVLSNNEFKINFNHSHDLTQQIAEIIIKQDWGLIEISPVKKNLETLFIASTEEPA